MLNVRFINSRTGNMKNFLFYQEVDAISSAETGGRLVNLRLEG